MNNQINVSNEKSITLYQKVGSRQKANAPEGFVTEFKIVSGDTFTLSKAVEFDNCPAMYKGGYRKSDNFIKADCILADVDNTHSDEPSEWITHDDVIKLLEDVEFYYYPSRNHMKPKEGKTPRPKEHYIFPTNILSSVEEYAFTMKKLIGVFPELHFDVAVKGGAQLNFGVENPKVDFHKGICNLSEFLNHIEISTKENSSTNHEKVKDFIPQGKRHNTMLSYACKTLKKLGDTDEAFSFYMQETEKCSPPLEAKEIDSIWRSAVDFYEREIKTASDYILPDSFNSLADKLSSYIPNTFTDIGQAELFSKIYYHKLRYSMATGFLVYNGKKWEENPLKARRLLHYLTHSQVRDSRKKIKEAEENLTEEEKKQKDKRKNQEFEMAKKYRNFALSRQVSKNLDATLKEAQPVLEINLELLDKDWFLLNTPEGTIDLRTKEMQPHNYEDYCTKITAKSPSDEGNDLFYKFLDEITCGNKVLEVYLQFIAGMIAVGKVFCEHLIIAYGHGKNGKSTLFNLLSLVLGDYSGSISSETLTAHCRKNKSPEYAELRGKRFVIAAELEDGMRLDTAIVKKLCSTDPVQAEKKYKAPFHFVPSHSIVLYTNHLPNVSALDNGTWRRLKVVPFNAVIDEQSERKNYADFLFENAGGAVMKWIVDGAYKFISAGCKIEQPDIVSQAIQEYREENDWLVNYISERCEIGKSFIQPANALYEDYRKFSNKLGETPTRRDVFLNALVEKGYDKHRNSKGSFVHGLRLASTMEEYERSQLPEYVPLNVYANIIPDKHPVTVYDDIIQEDSESAVEF